MQPISLSEIFLPKGAVRETGRTVPGITLEPGDIIATGTPSGVALGMNPPKYLVPGETVSIEITAIGELVNAVAAGLVTS